MESISFNELIESFSRYPRDVCSVPLVKRQPVWFYVNVESGKIWINEARAHKNSSRLAARRELKESEYDDLWELFQRRKDGDPVSGPAHEKSRNSIYWFGIFADMNW